MRGVEKVLVEIDRGKGLWKTGKVRKGLIIEY